MAEWEDERNENGDFLEGEWEMGMECRALGVLDPYWALLIQLVDCNQALKLDLRLIR